MRRKHMLDRVMHRTAQWRLTDRLRLTGERRGFDLKSRRGYFSGPLSFGLGEERGRSGPHWMAGAMPLERDHGPAPLRISPCGQAGQRLRWGSARASFANGSRMGSCTGPIGCARILFSSTRSNLRRIGSGSRARRRSGKLLARCPKCDPWDEVLGEAAA
jgi:hypothetical protein